MTVEEAFEYSNIGINRIRELCKGTLMQNLISGRKKNIDKTRNV